MTELLYGAPLWSRILKQATLSGSRKAAIAYIGSRADELISFKSGDTVVFDGSDNALRCGNTNPETIATWLDAGAALYSYDGLHAKVLVLGRTVFVGSANLSFNSRHRLVEAAVVGADPGLRHSAVAMIQQLVETSVERVGSGWVDEARRLYRPARGTQAGRRTNNTRASSTLPSGKFRLLLGQAGESSKWTSAEERKDQEIRDSLLKQRGPTRQYGLFGWEIGQGSGPVNPGDVWVIVDFGGGDTPISVYSPRRVLRVLDISKRRRMAYLRTEHRLPDISFSVVKQAVKDAGGRWVWDRNIAAPAVRDAVLELWGLHE